MKSFRHVLLLTVILFLPLLSCGGGGRKEKILKEDEMAEVMTDLYMMYGIQYTDTFREMWQRADTVDIHKGVFKKHGITRARFDSSMAHYARNPEELTRIIEEVIMNLDMLRDSLDAIRSVR